MELGDAGRQQIKGHDVKYYLDVIGEVRAKTHEGLKKKDDKWLLALDPELVEGAIPKHVWEMVSCL